MSVTESDEYRESLKGGFQKADVAKKPVGKK